ncbi:hypothetical protein BGW80DRAFT_857365 [Lactifluus volemus]|nr:hypothetical protein BGW80DRAFT_857365 [Lactifluus volemus]
MKGHALSPKKTYGTIAQNSMISGWPSAGCIPALATTCLLVLSLPRHTRIEMQRACVFVLGLLLVLQPTAPRILPEVDCRRCFHTQAHMT